MFGNFKAASLCQACLCETRHLLFRCSPQSFIKVCLASLFLFGYFPLRFLCYPFRFLCYPLRFLLGVMELTEFISAIQPTTRQACLKTACGASDFFITEDTNLHPF